MANTYTLITSNVLSTTTANVTLSSIPSTYTDLLLKYSIRGSAGAATDTLILRLNGSSSAVYSRTRLTGDGTNASSARTSSATSITTYLFNASASTSNTFTSGEIYIPSYTLSQHKPLSLNMSEEDNSATAYTVALAGLFRDTATISSIYLEGNFVSGSSFYLYGVKNA
jgi:hypothetical protein